MSSATAGLMIVGLSKDRRRRRHDGREAGYHRGPAPTSPADKHADVLRESVAWMSARLLVATLLQGPAPRTASAPDRLTHRNGYRPRAWETRVGEIELAIPKLRQGSYFP